MVSPTEETVDMPIDNTFVGMVNRDEFDPWLRQRAQQNGVEIRTGAFQSLQYEGDNVRVI